MLSSIAPGLFLQHTLWWGVTWSAMENLTSLTWNPTKLIPLLRWDSSNVLKLLDSSSTHQSVRKWCGNMVLLPSALHLFSLPGSTFKFKLQMLLENVHLNKKKVALQKETYIVENCSTVHKHIFPLLRDCCTPAFHCCPMYHVPFPVSSGGWRLCAAASRCLKRHRFDLTWFSSAVGTQ